MPDEVGQLPKKTPEQARETAPGQAGKETAPETTDDEPRFGLTKARPQPQTGPGSAAPGKPAGEGFRFAAIGALLIVVLFAGYGLGRLNSGPGPATPSTPRAAPSATPFDESQPHTHGDTAPLGTTGSAPVSGLSLSGNGLTLTPVTTTFQANRPQRLEFTINGPGGAPVTTFDVVHDKPLHLIVIRRDLTGFQHVHPVMAPDGTWSVDLTLAEPGPYRMIADFTARVGGTALADSLGSDLTVAGDYAPVTVPDPARVATVGDFQVAYEGSPSTQSTQPILMSVTDTAGGPVALEPYLGAFGHLVVLRQNDLGYVHVHPETELADGKVKFWLSAPSPGTYRMFLDFQVAGKVSTATWTVIVS